MEASASLLSDRERVSKSSTELLNAVVDVVDALNTSATVACEERVQLDSTTNKLFDILSQDPEFIYALPRRLSDKDKSTIKSYEHPGLHIGFSLPSNEVLILNVYGGLRRMDFVDLDDNDKNLVKTHTSRTEEIVSKPTYININMNGIDGKNKLDIWVVKNPNLSMFLNTLKIDNEFVDINPSITSKETYGYAEINTRLEQNIKELVNLVAPKPGSFEKKQGS